MKIQATSWSSTGILFYEEDNYSNYGRYATPESKVRMGPWVYSIPIIKLYWLTV